MLTLPSKAFAHVMSFAPVIALKSFYACRATAAAGCMSYADKVLSQQNIILLFKQVCCPSHRITVWVLMVLQHCCMACLRHVVSNDLIAHIACSVSICRQAYAGKMGNPARCWLLAGCGFVYRATQWHVECQHAATRVLIIQQDAFQSYLAMLAWHT